MADNKADRARQFMPFAALTGYYETIKRRERVCEPRKELSEDEIEILSGKLGRIEKGMLVTLTYYNEDFYDKLTGIVTGIDPVFGKISVVKTAIHFDDIIDAQIIQNPQV